jgi:ComF family protein
MRWPGSCTVCHGWGRSALCAACAGRFAAAVPRCRRCGLQLGQAADRCGGCIDTDGAVDRTVCALDYGFPWQGLITRFKFGGDIDLAPALAERLADAVRRETSGSPLPPLVVPVPLSRRRLAERGFNQSWELARRVARALGLQAHPGLLLRVLDGDAQSLSSRAERLARVRGAFAPAASASAVLAGQPVALVDDVLTTGATAQAAAAALRRAGAASVQLWVLARTPAPQH